MFVPCALPWCSLEPGLLPAHPTGSSTALSPAATARRAAGGPLTTNSAAATGVAAWYGAQDVHE